MEEVDEVGWARRTNIVPACESNKHILEKYKKMFEPRTSAGAFPKLRGWEKPHAKNSRVVLWYGRLCKEMCGTILRAGEQKQLSAALQSRNSVPWWPSIQRRRMVCWRIVKSMLLNRPEMPIFGNSSGQRMGEARKAASVAIDQTEESSCTDGHLSSQNAELAWKCQKYKGRVVLRGDIAKDDAGSCAVFTEQGSSASQMTAAKIMDVIARLPGCAVQGADAVSACNQVKMEDAPGFTVRCPDILIRLPWHTWPKCGSSWTKLKRTSTCWSLVEETVWTRFWTSSIGIEMGKSTELGMLIRKPCKRTLKQGFSTQCTLTI